MEFCYREDCIAVRESFCYNEWAMIEDNKQRGIHLTNRGHFRLPYCEKLPSVHEKPWACSHAHITDFRHEEVTSEYTFFDVESLILLHTRIEHRSRNTIELPICRDVRKRKGRDVMPPSPS